MNELELNKAQNLEIRELLTPSTSVALDYTTLSQHSMALINTILNTPHTIDTYDAIKSELTTLYTALKGIFDYAKVPLELRNRQFLNQTGFVMSPAHAITTIQDVFRVSGFIRSIDQAIQDLRQIYPNEQLHILYPACGPLAPLLLPLLLHYRANGIYTPDELQVTFIDIQEGAVMALRELLKVTDLIEYVKDVLLMDAIEYRKSIKIHLVILEAMQHGFSKEGHLSIAKHFAALLDEKGIFLPQEIRIDAVITTGEEEYNEQWREQDFTLFAHTTQEAWSKRELVGRVLTINLETLRNMEVMELNPTTRLIQCATLHIPILRDKEHHHIMLFTSNITIYGEEEINEYDSGITHPLPDMNICINFIPQSKEPSDLYVQSGNRITFYYKLVGIPGFLVLKEER